MNRFLHCINNISSAKNSSAHKATLTKTKSLSLLFLVFLLSWGNVGWGQSPVNGGFESNGSVTTTPTSWTVSGTTTTVNARTGDYCLLSNSSTSTSNTAHTNASTISIPPLGYGITIAWAKGINSFSTASAGGSLNGVNASTTFAVIGTTLTQLTYKSAQNITAAAVTYSCRVNSRSSTSPNATQVYFDDVITYASTTNVPDIIKPTAASSFTNGVIASTSVDFSWTNGSDAATGIQNTIILRTTNLSASVPAMNDQGVYSIVGGTSGPNIVSTDWTVVSVSVAAASTTYSDNTVSASTSYKYAVIHRDLAYNYSTALVSGTITTTSPGATPPTLSTTAASSITNIGATLNGSIITIGNLATNITSRGFEYSTSSSLTAPTSINNTGTFNTGSYNQSASSLIPNTVYYFRAFAVNNATPVQTGYSHISGYPTFTTLHNAPTIGTCTTPTSTGFTANWSAPTGGGAANFGYEIQASTDNTFATGINTFTISSSASPATNVACTGLLSGTTYYYRVRAVNTGGNSTWSGVSSGCTTNLAPPTVTTTPVSAITSIGANCGGNVTAAGGPGATFSDRGVVFHQTINLPAYADAGSIIASSGGSLVTGVFSGSVSGLSPQTLYYYRAYATNTPGVYGYGAANNFYTLSSPVVATAANLFANTFSFSQIDLSWDAANWPVSGAAVKGYVLVRNSGSAPVFTAVNGTAPAACVTTGTLVSSTIGEAVTSYSNTGLLQSTNYYFALIPFTWDGANVATCNYSTAISATASTPLGPCTPPATQATAAAIASPTVGTLAISWTIGAGDRTLVIVRQGSAVNLAPVSGTSYTANAAFTAGDNLGGGNFICYNGTGNSFTLTNLSAATTYYISVYTFNLSGYCFNLISPATTSGTTSIPASVIETFETATKGSYAAAPTTGTLGVWQFDDALVGSTANDRFVGTRSARLVSNGSITTLFDKTGGLGIVSLKHALYGATTIDPTTTWQLNVSDDGGATFTAYQSTVQTTNSNILTTATFTVNVTGNNIRIRILKLTGGASSRLNIDDISLSDYASTNTIATGAIAGSPYCVTSAAGVAVSVPFTAAGIYYTGNVYTAQLSDALGSFASPIDIGTISSVALSGTIASVIPAGTVAGSNYRVRVVSSDPVITGTTSSSALTVFLNTLDVDNLYTGSASTQVTLGWINPVSCFNEIMVVASTSIIACIPSGDGTSYTANSIYGSGTSCNGSFVVYKGSSNTVTVTGLTNGVNYYFKVFVRNGTLWSPGVSITAVPNDFLVGDYRSRIGTHLYSGTDNGWEAYAGGGIWNATTTPPNGVGINVYIINASIIQLSQSYTNYPINNLIVEQGGIIRSSSANNVYLTIYGNIICNGTIGNGTTPNSICFNIEGTNSTISGAPTGVFDANRIRKSFAVNTTSNLIIAKDLNLRWSSATSTGTALYNAAVNTNFNVTVNSNTVVSVILDPNTPVGTSGSVCIDGIIGSDFPANTEKGGTFTVNGTLNVPGILYATTDNATLPCKWVIGSTGVINCNQVNCNASGAGTNTLQILNGGRLNMNTNTGFNYAVFSSTNNVYDFQPGSIVEYSAASGISSILTNLTYSNLLLSGGGTRDMINNLGVSSGLELTVNKNLSITGSTTLDPVSNSINVGGNWNNYASLGFAEGTSNITFTGFSGAQKIVCPGGEVFYNMLVTNNTASGVGLDADVEVKNDLTLGASGRLFFGATPNILRLSKMAPSSNSLIGTAGSLIDMSSSASTLFVGSENVSYSGTFNAGTTSLVNYNRDLNIVSAGGSGNQNINNSLVYANLSFSGTSTKNVFANNTVNATLTVDGATTSVEAGNSGLSLTLGGDLMLSGGATMGGSTGNSCLVNLSLVTAGNSLQTFDAGFETINCYNLSSNKTTNGIVLHTGNTNMTVNNLLTQTTAATFTPNNNRVKIGGGWNLWGSAGFIKGTSTIEYNGPASENIIAVNYYNLESSNTGSRIMANSGIIGIENVFTPSTNSYTFTGSTVDYNGAIAQNIATFIANNTTGRTYNNLTLSNAGAKSLIGTTDVEGALTLNNSVIFTLGNYDLQLKSTVGQTASVAAVSPSATISYGTGKFVVERYINTGTGLGQHLKSWQFLAAPAVGQTIKQSWMENASANANPNPGYGTQIPGIGGIANGFDVSSTTPSIKYFNAADSAWVGLTNTSQPINNAEGYMIFIRGDRSVINFSGANSTPLPTTLRSKGTINVGNQSSSIILAGKFSAIGNPYPSAIDFSTLTRTGGGVDPNFYLFDPTLQGSLSLGGYQTISAAAGYRATPGNFMTTSTLYNTTDDYRNIQSGQAFFVRATTTNGTIGFKESDKANGSRLISRPAIASSVISMLSTNLLINNGSSLVLADGNRVVFNDTYTNEVNGDDAIKTKNAAENLGLYRNEKLLSVEARGNLRQTDTLYYRLAGLRPSNYQLMFVPENISSTGLTAELIDQYLQLRLPVSLSDTGYINFVVTTEPASLATDRFLLVFKPAAGLLSINSIDISATRKNDNEIAVNWQIEKEMNLHHYELEYSTDGRQFTSIATVAPRLNNGTAVRYVYSDIKGLETNHFYRVKTIGLNNQIQYSSIVKIGLIKIDSHIAITPNPVVDGHVQVLFTLSKAQSFSVQLCNLQGQVLYKDNWDIPAGLQKHCINGGPFLSKGIYQLKVLADDGNSQLLRFTVN